MRAEIKHDFHLGRQLAMEVDAFYYLHEEVPKAWSARIYCSHAWTRQVVLAIFCSTTPRPSDAGFDHYSIVLSTKAKLHSVLGQHTMAIATLRLADEAFLAMTGKQVVEEVTF